MLEDSEVDLVEVLLWCGNSAATTIDNCVQSLACESPLSFMNKATSRCRPDEEATSM
jgi:hypothetical protein